MGGLSGERDGVVDVETEASETNIFSWFQVFFFELQPQSRLRAFSFHNRLFPVADVFFKRTIGDPDFS